MFAHLPIRTSAPARRGVSLVEMAFVVGLFGFVVASVMAIYSKLGDQNSTNRAADEVGIIADNVRSYSSGVALPTGFLACTVTPTFATNYSGYGFFPKDMLSGSPAVVVNHPWGRGTTVATSTAAVAFCGPNPTSFVIRYKTIMPQNCTNLLVRTSSLAANAGLYKVVVQATASTTLSTVASQTNSGAITPTAANAACTTASATTPVTSIDWYFKIGG